MRLDFRWIAGFVVIIATACGSVRGSELFLRRVVGEDGNQTYPDPLDVNEHRRPSSLREALEMLDDMTPGDSVSGPIGACGFTSIDDLDIGYQDCLTAASRSLPETSREAGYLIRLSQWTDANWLDGRCGNPARAANQLEIWFQERGIAQCWRMRVALVVLFARNRIGIKDDDGFLEILRDP